jgi:DNA gyrase subunit A
MICVKNPQDETVLVVSEKGYGKRTFIDDEDGEPVYRITNRGGKGVKTISISDKTGELVALKTVHDEDDLMIIKKSGVAIRMSVSDIRTMGRSTQGVRLISLKGDDEIAAVAKIVNEDEDENDNTDSFESNDETIN